MRAIDEISKINKRALPSFCRAVARPLQARRLAKALQYPVHEVSISAEFDEMFFSSFRPIAPDGRSLYDLTRRQDDEPKVRHRLQLGRDALLPWPWHRDRLVNTLSTIGRSKGASAWRSDHNHQVQLVLPFGLAFVLGGNHSIAAGVVDGEGEVVADARDISAAYHHVFYDGCEFRRKHDGTGLSAPTEEEPGVLFELGRRMLELGVEYDAPAV
ncbi:MAG: hypothetical protein QM732_25735 [Roseateles sp.]